MFSLVLHTIAMRCNEEVEREREMEQLQKEKAKAEEEKREKEKAASTRTSDASPTSSVAPLTSTSGGAADMPIEEPDIDLLVDLREDTIVTDDYDIGTAPYVNYILLH
jgi:hypothetical protein